MIGRQVRIEVLEVSILLGSGIERLTGAEAPQQSEDKELYAWSDIMIQERVQRAEAYRFIYLRSLHPPIIVRIELLRGSKMHLYVKVGDITERGDAWRFDYEKDRQLRDFEVKQVQKFLYGLDLLSMEAFDLSEESGFDGSTSAFELIRNGKHHFVSKWSPSEGPLYYFGVYLLYLAGIEGEWIF